jgi:hypothetical protein
MPTTDQSAKDAADARDLATFIAWEAAARAMLAALEIAAPRLPCPDHAGDIDPALAKRGIASSRPYAQNTCGCERHQTLRTVWAAIAAAKAAGL